MARRRSGVVPGARRIAAAAAGHHGGHGGAESEAQRLGVPFLGAVPLDMDVRLRSDNGQAVCWGQAEVVTEAPSGVPFLALDVDQHSACGIRADNRFLMCWGSRSWVYPDNVAFDAVAVANPGACAIRA